MTSFLGRSGKQNPFICPLPLKGLLLGLTGFWPFWDYMSDFSLRVLHRDKNEK